MAPLQNKLLQISLGSIFLLFAIKVARGHAYSSWVKSLVTCSWQQTCLLYVNFSSCVKLNFKLIMCTTILSFFALFIILFNFFMWFEKIAKETADSLAKYSPEEHIPLEKVMLAMAIKAISVAGMGREFFDKKEIEKLETAYGGVRIGFHWF